MRIDIELQIYSALVIRNRCLAVRAPWSARLVAAKGSVKRHETFPRKTSAAEFRHGAAVGPRKIWSQQLLNSTPRLQKLPLGSGLSYPCGRVIWRAA